MSPDSNRGERPVERGRLQLPGGEIGYEVAGEGPPVLFIHSVIADQRMWDREFLHCSAGHRAIRFNLRGFGDSSPASAPFSYTEDIHLLLQHIGARRPLLVGSSMGGAFAIDYALAHPDGVRGLLLAAPGLSGGFAPPFDAKEQKAFEYDDAKSQQITQAWSRGDAGNAIDLLRLLWCSALTGPNLALFRRMVEENANEVFDNRSMQFATSAPPAAGKLGDIHLPTTILLGSQDNPSSEVFARRIAQAIPGANFVTVPRADHLINLSRPEEFDRALHALLESD